MQGPQLSSRGAAVLDAVIERFIATGEPVGSVAISEMLSERVSAATVRNTMAELERLGYLEQPHTSAGRKPTLQGYHRHVEQLLTEGRAQAVDESRLRHRLDTDPLEVPELLHRSCRLLAELSELVGMVSVPPLGDTILQHIEFIRLEGPRVLVVVAARNGQVDNRVVILNEPVSQEQLDRAAEYLVSRFSGRSLREVARRLRALHEEARERLDAQERQAIRLGARSFDGLLGEPDVLVEGAYSLLGKPDFQAREDLRAVLSILEQRRVLAGFLHPSDDEPDAVRVLIGADGLPEELCGCTRLAASYSSGDSAAGSVALLGPTRLEYARAIGLVRAIARTTTELLAHAG